MFQKGINYIFCNVGGIVDVLAGRNDLQHDQYQLICFNQLTRTHFGGI